MPGFKLGKLFIVKYSDFSARTASDFKKAVFLDGSETEDVDLLILVSIQCPSGRMAVYYRDR